MAKKKTAKKKMTLAELQAKFSLGGSTTLKRYGKDHFKKIAATSAKVRRAKAK